MSKRRGTRKISLSSELHLVSRAVDGMRILTEKWRDAHFNREELPRLAHALHGTLVLVRERLTLLDCAVRDTLDPRYLSCHENEVFVTTDGEDADIILRSWSAKKTAEKLQREADQAARRAEVLAERRRRVEEG